MSELRVIEVMENVCSAMQHYGQFSTKPLTEPPIKGKEDTNLGVPYFQRINNEGGDTAITISGSGLADLNSIAGRQTRDELRRHCDALLEVHEEGVAELIRGGLEEPMALGQQLCIAIAAQCSAQQILRVPSEARLAGLQLPGMDPPEKPPAPPTKRSKKRIKKAAKKDEL